MFRFLSNVLKRMRSPAQPNWRVEKDARPTAAHPLGGFWKRNVKHDHGLAIGPAGAGMYYVSFCGPGGCFEKETYRPNTPIVGDPAYRVIDNDTLEVRGKKGFNRYFRVTSRQRRTA